MSNVQNRQMDWNHAAANLSEIITMAEELRSLVRNASANPSIPVANGPDSVPWDNVAVIAGNLANVTRVFWEDEEGPIA